MERWWKHPAFWPVLLSGVGYVWVAVWMPLPLNLYTPAGLRQFTPSLGLGALYGLWVTGLFGLYLWLYRLAGRGVWQPRPCLLPLLALLIAFPTIFAYPFNASDLFHYAIRGHLTAVEQRNPYTTPPSADPNHPFVAHTGEWSDHTSPYGPVWELSVTALAHLTRASDLATPILLKFYSLLAFVLTGWLITQLRGVPLGVLWLFNPALILIFGVDGHNDSLMLLWLVLGWWVWVRLGERWPRWAALLAFGLMFLSPLTKAIGLLPLPFFWLYLVRQQKSTHGRVQVALATIVVSLILTILFFLPFGSPSAWWGGCSTRRAAAQVFLSPPCFC
jgi:hypothetical protein